MPGHPNKGKGIRKGRKGIMTIYQLTGYEKDAGLVHCFEKGPDPEALIPAAELLARQMDEGALKHPETGECFDWIEIAPSDDPDLLYWASYPLPEIPTRRETLGQYNG